MSLLLYDFMIDFLVFNLFEHDRMLSFTRKNEGVMVPTTKPFISKGTTCFFYKHMKFGNLARARLCLAYA